MPLDMNDPEVLAAVEAASTKIAEDMIKDKYVSKEEITGLDNKNKELLGKLVQQKELKEKYGDVTDEDWGKFKELQVARENDEFVKLITDGKLKEAQEKMTSGVNSAWEEKYGDINAQFNVSQERIKELEFDVESRQQQVIDMQKKQLLRDMTNEDDSFRSSHFEDFYRIYADKLEIDESGKSFAIGSDGKRELEIDGSAKTFQTYYNKQKTSSGLFWESGKGSGIQGIGSDGSDLTGANPSEWSFDQKMAYMQENGGGAEGQKKFAELLTKKRKK